MQRPWLGLLGLSVVLVISRPGFAMAQQCSALTAELARLDRSIAANDFSGAAQRQRGELATARAQKNRCETSGAGDCSRFAALVAGMEANLTSLERRAGQNKGGASLQVQRATLQRRLAAACTDVAPSRRAQTDALAPVAGLLSWLSQGVANQTEVNAVNQPPPPPSSGAGVRPEPKQTPKPPFRPSNLSSPAAASGGGAYRTLCVRACDGYFWPISYQTSARHFAKDADTCRSACPGREVSLYVHRNPGGGSDDAVSLSGKPYTALKTAYRFRREFDRTCGCQAGAGAARQVIEELNGAAAPPPTETTLPADEQKLPVRISTRPDHAQAGGIIGEFGLRGSTQPGAVD